MSAEARYSHARRYGHGQGVEENCKDQGRSWPLEAARAISEHTRETCRAVGSHTGLVRAHAQSR
jgi:hypothetical protein